ncbi:MAG: 30S ribosomal protein S8 [bacterium]
MTDPIADMLTRLRNALAVKKAEVIVPHSKIKLAIAEILKKNGYIVDYEKTDDNYGEIKIILKYRESGKPAITFLKRISKPGRRVYAPKDELPVVLNSLGIAIISTSQGIMTNKSAKKAGVGGEVLCEIY